MQEGAMTRFHMRLDAIWRPLLALFGGTQGASYVDVGKNDVRFGFGVLFRETVARGDIASVAGTTWPLYGGIGWRLTLNRRVGLIGSRTGVVEVRLREPRQVRFGLLRLPWRFEAICVSLDDPAGFIAVLSPDGEAAE
jgi:hypothetical protein